MRILFISPASLQYRWESEVLLCDLRRHGWPMDRACWITYGDGERECHEVASRYGAEHLHYDDDRPAAEYAPSIRPWLWARYLEEDPSRQRQAYFYCDSDIIFSRLPDFDAIEVAPTRWFGSQTASYTGTAALSAGGGAREVAFLMELMHVSRRDAVRFANDSPGAQWLIHSPTPEFFRQVYVDAESIFIEFERRRRAESRPGRPERLQPWLSDMWALLWNTPRFGIEASATALLDFSVTADPRVRFEEAPIHHNSGAAPWRLRAHRLFSKREWRDRAPFGERLALDRTTCSIEYGYAIARVDPTTRIIPV